MDAIVLLVILLITHGVITESFNKKIIVAHREEEISLPLPEHLRNQTKYVWKKVQEHIATSFGNGSLDIPDPKYTERLSCAHGGSLIIKALYWQDEDDYSVDILTIDNSRSIIHYQVIVQRYKHIQKDTGPIIVYTRVEEDVILPLEDGVVAESEIVEIDWLTERWVYLAATKVDGNIHIPKNNYEGKLSSSPNGSLIFNKVTKKNQGVYRANIFSNKGKIVEQMYRLIISDQYCEPYLEKRTSTELSSVSENKMTSPVFIGLYICITMVIISAGCLISVIKRDKSTMETIFCPKEYNKTRRNNDTLHLEYQTHLHNSSLLSA
ncbi:uncharacterized protein [Aquarana catesbeiana]|uniref:uncharacterized protein n=1 Tax=Aquarana catesbeiana TaxID=8400 RepID=UPI003CC9D956